MLTENLGVLFHVATGVLFWLPFPSSATPTTPRAGIRCIPGGGSIEIIGAVRSDLLFALDPDDEAPGRFDIDCLAWQPR